MTILSPCIIALTVCLFALVLSIVGAFKGDTFADIGVFTYLLLSVVVLTIDIVTKKMTKYRKAYYWILQAVLLFGLYFLTRLIIGAAFSIV